MRKTPIGFGTLTMLLGLLLALTLVSKSYAEIDGATLHFEPCQIKNQSQVVDAECGTLTRQENPAAANGKTLNLFVAKFASTSPEPEADAFTIIQGGPGASSIDFYLSLAPLLKDIRAKRDILVIDQRGTGRSNGLICPELSEEQLAAGLDPEVAQEQAINCIESIDSDLAFYTTSLAVNDLEAMRVAAGYQQLTIYGVSYGTRVAQHYLRRFPQQARAVIIDGVAHVGLNLAGGEIARQSQAAFDNMVARCAELASCNERFGDIQQKFLELRELLEQSPPEVSYPHPVSGKTVTRTLSEWDLLGTVRLMPYSTEQLSLLPLLISEAHSGNYLPLASQSSMVGEDFLKNYAVAMNNTVVCAEDAPFVTEQDLVGAKGTFFGTHMADVMAAVCEIWPRGPVDDDFLEPFDSEQPVLILSGETDPITPPKNGEIAHQMLSNSKHLIVPAHGHGVISRGCIPALVSNFVEQANFDDMKTDCIEREQAMPFFFDPTGPTP